MKLTNDKTLNGKLLKELRMKELISTVQIFENTGIQRSSLRLTEIGEKDMNICTAAKLLNYMGYDLEIVKRQQ